MVSYINTLLPVKYGHLLKQFRESRGMTQKELGQFVGFSPSHVGGVEATILIPTRRLTEGVIKALRLSPEQTDELLKAEEEVRHVATVDKAIKYICRQRGIDCNADIQEFLTVILNNIDKMTQEDMREFTKLLSKY